MSYILPFRTAKFNPSVPCPGEDVAEWLRGKLAEAGFTSDEQTREEWGWVFGLPHHGKFYFIGIVGQPDEQAEERNQGDWEILIEKHRTAAEKLFGTNKLSEQEPIVLLIERLLVSEGGIRMLVRD